jgi:hypothetical protein
LNSKGQSTGLLSAQVAVVAGNKVTLTIAASGGGTETGYVIYRSRKNGTSTVGDLREMDRIQNAGASTVYVGLPAFLPMPKGRDSRGFLLIKNIVPSSAT